MKEVKGFTLVEIITVLVLVGIISSFGVFGIVKIVKGYEVYKDGSELSRMSQLLTFKLIRELSYVESINVGESSNTKINYNANFPSFITAVQPREITYSSDMLYLNGFLLAENVSSFLIQYCAYDSSYSEICSPAPDSDTKFLRIYLDIYVNNIHNEISIAINTML